MTPTARILAALQGHGPARVAGPWVSTRDGDRHARYDAAGHPVAWVRRGHRIALPPSREGEWGRGGYWRPARPALTLEVWRVRVRDWRDVWHELRDAAGTREWETLAGAMAEADARLRGAEWALLAPEDLADEDEP